MEEVDFITKFINTYTSTVVGSYEISALNHNERFLSVIQR